MNFRSSRIGCRSALVVLALAAGTALLLACETAPDAVAEGADAVVAPQKGEMIQAKVTSMLEGTNIDLATDDETAKAQKATEDVTADDLDKLLAGKERGEDATAAIALVSKTDNTKRGSMYVHRWNWQAGDTKFLATVTYLRSPSGEEFVYAERGSLRPKASGGTGEGASLTRELFVFDRLSGGLFTNADTREVVSRDRTDYLGKGSAADTVAKASLAPDFGVRPRDTAPAADDDVYQGNRTACNLCLGTLRTVHSLGTVGPIIGQVTARLLNTASMTAICALAGAGAGVASGAATTASVVGAPAAPVAAVAAGTSSFLWCTRVIEGVSLVFGAIGVVNAVAAIPEDPLEQMKMCNKLVPFGGPICVELAPKHCRLEFVTQAKTPVDRCKLAIQCAIDGYDRDQTPCAPSDPMTWCKKTLLLEDSVQQDMADATLCAKALPIACEKRARTDADITAVCAKYVAP